MYLLIKYIKSVLWRVVKRLSCKQDAPCLKVKRDCPIRSRHLLTLKANEMQYFSDLFNKVLYMFRTAPLYIIRSISTSASRRQQNQLEKYLLRVYSVEILLMMDSGPV